ncbi:MAG: hypothetical protein NTU94_09705 [Planctomycetota bacterium]|nr:hypothetical protein [Planctomycetota bacterium]
MRRMSTKTRSRGSLSAAVKNGLGFQPGKPLMVRTSSRVPSGDAHAHRMYSRAARRFTGSVMPVGMAMVHPPTQEESASPPSGIGMGAWP